MKMRVNHNTDKVGLIGEVINVRPVPNKRPFSYECDNHLWYEWELRPVEPKGQVAPHEGCEVRSDIIPIPFRFGDKVRVKKTDRTDYVVGLTAYEGEYFGYELIGSAWYGHNELELVCEANQDTLRQAFKCLHEQYDEMEEGDEI